MTGSVQLRWAVVHRCIQCMIRSSLRSQITYNAIVCRTQHSSIHYGTAHTQITAQQSISTDQSLHTNTPITTGNHPHHNKHSHSNKNVRKVKNGSKKKLRSKPNPHELHAHQLRLQLINKLYLLSLSNPATSTCSFNYITQLFDTAYKYDQNIQQYVRCINDKATATDIDLLNNFIINDNTESVTTNTLLQSHENITYTAPTDKNHNQQSLYDPELNNTNTTDVKSPSRAVQAYIIMRDVYRNKQLLMYNNNTYHTGNSNHKTSFSILQCDARFYNIYHSSPNNRLRYFESMYKWDSSNHRYINKRSNTSAAQITEFMNKNKRMILTNMHTVYCKLLNVPCDLSKLSSWTTDNNNILYHIFYTIYQWDSFMCNYTRIGINNTGLQSMMRQHIDPVNLCFRPYKTVHPDIFTCDLPVDDPAYIPPKLRRMLKKVKSARKTNKLHNNNVNSVSVDNIQSESADTSSVVQPSTPVQSHTQTLTDYSPNTPTAVTQPTIPDSSEVNSLLHTLLDDSLTSKHNRPLSTSQSHCTDKSSNKSTEWQRKEALRLIMSPNVDAQHKTYLNKLLIELGTYDAFDRCIRHASKSEQNNIVHTLNNTQHNRIQQEKNLQQYYDATKYNTGNEFDDHTVVRNHTVLLNKQLSKPTLRISDDVKLQAQHNATYLKQLHAYKQSQTARDQSANQSNDSVAASSSSIFGTVVDLTKYLFSLNSTPTEPPNPTHVTSTPSEYAEPILQSSNTVSTSADAATITQSIVSKSMTDTVKASQSESDVLQPAQKHTGSIVESAPTTYKTPIIDAMLDMSKFNDDAIYTDTTSPPTLSAELRDYVFPNNKLLYDPSNVIVQQSTSIIQFNKATKSRLSPYIELPDTQSIDYSRIPPFTTSSRDTVLHSQAQQYTEVEFVGSTSSTSSLLSHLHYVITRFRPIDTHLFSPVFHNMSRRHTRAARKPTSILLRRKSMTDTARTLYAIDNPPSSSHKSNQVLIDLGKVVERQLTMSPTQFNQLLCTVEIDDTARARLSEPESYAYMKYRSILFRAQLDCYDVGVPNLHRKVFDLKSRATLPIRLDCANYKHYLQYKLTRLYGELNSYEREYYDMARSAFMKYSMQCRIGNMSGVLVAYHNTCEVFGLQYIPVSDMNNILFGNTLTADKVYEHSMKLMNELLRQITARVQQLHPNADIIKITVNTSYQTSSHMKVYVEWHSADESKDIQSHLPWVQRHSSKYLAPLKSIDQIKSYLTELGVTYDGDSDFNMLLSQLEEILSDLDETTNKPTSEYYNQLIQNKQLLYYNLHIQSEINQQAIGSQSSFILLPTDQWTVQYTMKYKSYQNTMSLAKEYKRVLYRVINVGDDEQVDAAMDDTDDISTVQSLIQSADHVLDNQRKKDKLKQHVQGNIATRSLARIQQKLSEQNNGVDMKPHEFKHSNASDAVADMLSGVKPWHKTKHLSNKKPIGTIDDILIKHKQSRSKSHKRSPSALAGSGSRCKDEIAARRREIGRTLKKRMS